MRELEQYVRGAQLPEPKASRPALLRPSSVPARTASGGLGRRGEAQTPFQPVALVAGVRQERYLNGAGRVAIDPSQVSYVSYVADAGNVAVVDLSLPEALRPQNRFFRVTVDAARVGADAGVIASGVFDPHDELMAVWQNAQNGGVDQFGILRTEYAFELTFCIGTSRDDSGSGISINHSFGERTLQETLFSGADGQFQIRTRTGSTIPWDASHVRFANFLQISARSEVYAAALREAGVIGAAELRHDVSVGIKYTATQVWLGPSGFVQDGLTLAWVPVGDGTVLNRAVSDGVATSPARPASLTYRGF
jgi:hypothetical protein